MMRILAITVMATVAARQLVLVGVMHLVLDPELRALLVLQVSFDNWD